MKQINSKLVNFAEALDKLECFSSFIINYLIMTNHFDFFYHFFNLEYYFGISACDTCSQ